MSGANRAFRWVRCLNSRPPRYSRFIHDRNLGSSSNVLRGPRSFLSPPQKKRPPVFPSFLRRPVSLHRDTFGRYRSLPFHRPKMTVPLFRICLLGLVAGLISQEGFGADSPSTSRPGSRITLPSDATALHLGDAAPDFRLPGVDGKEHALADYAKAEVLMVIFSVQSLPVFARHRRTP